MKIIIATGGTGGHIFPAINVAVKLKREGHDVHFIGRFQENADLIQKKGFSIEELDVCGYEFRSVFPFISKMTKAVIRSIKKIRILKPNAVLGFGGYGSFPVVFAAALLRCPTLIHEQNVMPGKANAVLAKFVNKVAVSFDKSRKYFSSSKTVLTGCPCRFNSKQFERADILMNFGLKQDRTTILVFGGSQGSHRINEEFIRAVRILKDKMDIQVIHITGKDDFDKLKNEYIQINIPYSIFEFLDDIASAYKVADLVISRAGAGSITEIALFQLPAVLIPYPYAGAHQKSNAQMLEELGIAKMIEESDLTTENLVSAITDFLPNKISLEEIEKRVKGICFPDATVSLARETTTLVK